VADPLALARALSDDLLFPAAGGVEEAGAVPREHLDALAAAGLYGLTGPAGAGGLAADPATTAAVVEALASGDLATTFVWLQHLGVVPRVAQGPAHLRERYLADLCAGRVRAGVALQAALRPGPPAVRVRTTGSGADRFVLDGAVPWVTGWGHADLVLVAARDDRDDVLFLLADARESAGLRARRQDMVAVAASATVELELLGHEVGADRLVARVPLAELRAADPAGLRLNGSLALGVAARCARLLDGEPARRAQEAVAATRARLDAAGPGQLPAARAAASALAHRLSGLLVTATGSGALHPGEPAERLARESLFLLVFGSRPAIRAALVEALAAPPAP
jgi:alkylation response protein AidB-like acyl-CoA dehydrogenase